MRVILVLLVAAIPATLIAAPVEKKTQPVDVALCLDTSGSMDGLIDSAKRKLWALVNEMAKMEPMPDLRVALYSYGNNSYEVAKGWVRCEAALTTDLDEVYKRINALKTASAGSEEWVGRVSRAALGELKWSADKSALKLMFICGNEPVDQDKEVTLASVAEHAKNKGVLINTIYCGVGNHGDAAGWAAFATQCGGKSLHIDQNKPRSEAAIATPYDDEINKLGIKINTTFVWIGAKGAEGKANQVAQDGAATRAAGGAATERSITKAGELYKNESDLIERLKNDKAFDVKKMKDEDLPEELKKLRSAERETYLQKKLAERIEIQKKIGDLSAKRAVYIEAERAKQPKPAADRALDEALLKIIRAQAATKGIKVKD